MNANKIFFFKDLDSHYVIYFLGIRIQFKHKSKFKYKEAVEYGLTNTPRNPKLIVSLTTHPGRINCVHLTINTLLTQSLKPDKVILWLAESQFPDREKDLPEDLLKLRDLGLTIDWCEDLRSYKKLLPTLRKYPDDIIVTVDDDAYYDSELLSSLYNAYLQNGNNIYARRVVKLELNSNNELQSISARKYLYQDNFNPTFLHQLIGAFGVMYPPHSLHKDVYDIEKIKRLLPTHDDVYFWAMAVLNNTRIQTVLGYNADINYIEGSQDCGLIHINTTGGSGLSLEEAYKLMIKEYPQILQNIRQELENCR